MGKKSRARREEKKREKQADMCTIMGIFGLNSKFKDNKIVWQMAENAAKCLTGQSMNDGFGYSAIDAKGVQAGERWLDNKEAFSIREPVTSAERSTFEAQTKLLAPFGGAFPQPSLKEHYNVFGAPTKINNITSMILHARLATSPKILENTHPFTRDGLALVHNGVISNVSDIGLYGSSCDSEAILKAYIEGGVRENPDAIGKVADRLRGSYAVMVQGVLPDGTPYTDIFRNDTNKLYMVSVPQQNWKIFCTRPDIVVEMIKGWTHAAIGGIYPLEHSIMVRMDAEIGECISTHKFTTWAPGYGGSGGSSHHSSFHSNTREDGTGTAMVPFSRVAGTDAAAEVKNLPAPKDDDVIDDSTIRDMVKQSITDLHGTEGYAEFLTALERESMQ